MKLQNPMNLKIGRIKRGVKQIELAAMVGISQNLLSMYEAGKRNPSDETLSKIAEVLGCNIQDLI